MAAIRGLQKFNENRKELVKIKTASDETILFTKDEIKAVLLKYIDEELELFSNGITERQKN